MAGKSSNGYVEAACIGTKYDLALTSSESPLQSGSRWRRLKEKKVRRREELRGYRDCAGEWLHGKQQTVPRNKARAQVVFKGDFARRSSGLVSQRQKNAPADTHMCIVRCSYSALFGHGLSSFFSSCHYESGVLDLLLAGDRASLLESIGKRLTEFKRAEGLGTPYLIAAANSSDFSNATRSSRRTEQRVSGRTQRERLAESSRDWKNFHLARVERERKERPFCRCDPGHESAGGRLSLKRSRRRKSAPLEPATRDQWKILASLLSLAHYA